MMSRWQRRSGSRKEWRGILAAGMGGALLLSMIGASTAFGQVFEKFDETARTEMPATPFVAGAYAFIWVALMVYVFIIARGLRRAESQIAELRRRVETGPSISPDRQHPPGGLAPR